MRLSPSVYIVDNPPQQVEVSATRDCAVSPEHEILRSRFHYAVHGKLYLVEIALSYHPFTVETAKDGTIHYRRKMAHVNLAAVGEVYRGIDDAGRIVGIAVHLAVGAIPVANVQNVERSYL